MATASENPTIIVPFEILRLQTCTECYKYLSVGPVRITRKGKIICGRCRLDPEENLTPSLYNQIAEVCLFQCVNRNNGCPEFLWYNETKNHEMACKNSVYCPFCKYKADESELIQHFEEKHSENVVDETFEFIAKEGYSSDLIFLIDKHVLYITIKVDGEFLRICNTLLTPSVPKFRRFILNFFKFYGGIRFVTPEIRITPNCDRFPITYRVTCKEGDCLYEQLEDCFLLSKSSLVGCLRSGTYYGTMDYIEDENQSSELEANDSGISKKPISNIELLPEDIFFKNVDYVKKMEVPTLRKFIKTVLPDRQRCTKCKVRMRGSKNAFFCPHYHLACSKCTDGRCLECNSFVQWSNDTEWHKVRLGCEWGCNLEVNIFDYLRHMQLCKIRLYRCPDDNCQYVGYLDGLKGHWHLNRLGCSDKQKLFWQEQAFYWLLPDFNELVYVTVERDSSDCMLITVHEDDTILSSFYKFDVPRDLIEQDWVSLKDRTGRYIKLKFKQYLFDLAVSKFDDVS